MMAQEVVDITSSTSRMAIATGFPVRIMSQTLPPSVMLSAMLSQMRKKTCVGRSGQGVGRGAFGGEMTSPPALPDREGPRRASKTAI